ncbi:MAG: flagellar basal body-associated FliL family protein [Anaerocolumna sp.]|jgi:flagellar basal body-associated protein FliL|nr:flagellar basal body-associated FliL family protein [Anaerocolumna sp.]
MDLDNKFKIFVIIAIVFLGIAIAGSTFLIMGMVGKDEATSAGSNNGKSKMVTVDLGDAITSNVYDETGEQHIARVVISFSVNAASKQYKQFNKDFEGKKVIIRDEIIHIIREQTYEMMTRADAQTKLGDEVTERINRLLETQIIQDVYFGDFFVQ